MERETKYNFFQLAKWLVTFENDRFEVISCDVGYMKAFGEGKRCHFFGIRARPCSFAENGPMSVIRLLSEICHGFPVDKFGGKLHRHCDVVFDSGRIIVEGVFVKVQAVCRARVGRIMCMSKCGRILPKNILIWYIFNSA